MEPENVTDGAARAEQPVLKRKDPVREFIEAIVVALALALFIRTFIVQAFKIPSGSMIPTLLVGDHILVNKFVYGIPIPFTDKKLVQFQQPRRGEVIVFRFPKDPSKDFIKRVVGLPGDSVAKTDGVLRINGKVIEQTPQEDYVYKESPGSEEISNARYTEKLDGIEHTVIFSPEAFPPTRSFDPIKVPDGKIFMMGDNRDRSNDSRFWGFVDITQIEGRAIAIYWSWDSENFNVRWRRLGDLIH